VWLPGRRMGAGPIVAQQAASSTSEDDSVRCRSCQICEGADACGRSGDKTLACMTDSVARANAVKEAAKWAWKGYKEAAWGEDELHPMSRTSGSWFDLGLTLVDSLDTLLLMGLKKEYDEAAQWVSNSMRLDRPKNVNLFETTIRILGGLLSAYNLTDGDATMLAKAEELGERLMPAFRTKSGVPFSDVNLGAGTASSPKWGPDSSTSEVTTLYLEFSYLSRLTGSPSYEAAASGVMDIVDQASGRLQGLCPIMINPNTGKFRGNVFTLGARGDSFYEYLLKCWVISGRRDERCLRMYKEAMRGVRERLIDTTAGVGGLTYVAELKGSGSSAQKQPKMDHLVCFLPGLLALGHYHGVDTSTAKSPISDIELAQQLMLTCYETYRETPVGLAPEIVHFSKHDGDYPKQHKHDVGRGHFEIYQQDSHNLLRPETVESLWVMWQVTRDPVYREWAWLIFRAFEKHTRVRSGGYASLDSVLQVPPKKRDKMESFWLAETLKYLYLIFEERDLLPLDTFVMNTEAHPLPIRWPSLDNAEAVPAEARRSSQKAGGVVGRALAALRNRGQQAAVWQPPRAHAPSAVAPVAADGGHEEDGAAAAVERSAPAQQVLDMLGRWLALEEYDAELYEEEQPEAQGEERSRDDEAYGYHDEYDFYEDEEERHWKEDHHQSLPHNA